MIAKRSRGSDVAGLLRYLFGPGRANEHTDPHLVAAWDQEWLAGGMLAGLPRSRLARALDAHRLAHGIPSHEHVYHVVISLPERDGQLGDAVWREVLDDGIARMGLSQCRWVAVHHGPGAAGNDHVHLVLVDVEAGGHRPRLYRDYLRWREWCRAVEDRQGWSPTAPPGAGRSGTTRAEAARERRSGRQVGADRIVLLDAVHAAAAASADEAGFFARLSQHRIATRIRTDTDGQAVGYAVANTGPDGQQVGPWISGSRLRRDLSLPQLRRHRWPTHPAPAEQSLDALLGGCERELAGWLNRRRGPDPVDWCAAIAAVADLTLAVGAYHPELIPAARALAAAGQPPRHGRRRGGAVLPWIRLTARVLAAGQAGPALVAAAVLTVAALVVMLAAPAREVRLHAAARRHLRHAGQRTAALAGHHRRPAVTPPTPARRRALGEASAAHTPPPAAAKSLGRTGSSQAVSRAAAQRRPRGPGLSR